MRRSFRHFMADERGTQAIEYAVIAVLISIGILGVTRSIGSALTDLFFGPLLDGFKHAL